MRTALACVVALALCSCGATSPGPDGGTGKDCRGLAEAWAVAGPLLSAQLAGGVVNELLGGAMDDQGRLVAATKDDEWTWYAHVDPPGTDFLAVAVTGACEARTWNPGSAGNFSPIPAYTVAAPWIQVATAEAVARSITFNLRLLQVRAVESPTDYPGVTHLAYVYFHQEVAGDPRDPLIIVILDADDPRVLDTTQ